MKRFVSDQGGQAIVERALLFAIVVATAILLLSLIGGSVKRGFERAVGSSVQVEEVGREGR